jgi:hypothetical protein
MIMKVGFQNMLWENAFAAHFSNFSIHFSDPLGVKEGGMGTIPCAPSGSISWK